MKTEKFYQKPKNYPSKFTIIRWYLSQDEILGLWTNNKRDFFYDVLHQKRWKSFFSESHRFGAKDFIKKTP